MYKTTLDGADFLRTANIWLPYEIRIPSRYCGDRYVIGHPLPHLAVIRDPPPQS